MKTAILIGFFYVFSDIDNNYDSERKYLPGIIVDLYHNYQLIKNAGYDNIIVITDIEEDLKTSDLFKTTNNKIEPNMLGFIKRLQKNNHYYMYQSRHDFISILTKLFEKYDNTYLYYTGHFKNNYFVLPYDQYDYDNNITYIKGTIPTSINDQKEKSKLYIKEFIYILKKSDKISTIILLIDSCIRINLGLPFIFK